MRVTILTLKNYPLILYIRNLREALPNVWGLQILTAGIWLGSGSFHFVEQLPQVMYYWCTYVPFLSWLLHVLEDWRAWTSLLGVITFGENEGAGSDWVLGAAVHRIVWWVTDGLRCEDMTHSGEGLGVGKKARAWIGEMSRNPSLVSFLPSLPLPPAATFHMQNFPCNYIASGEG